MSSARFQNASVKFVTNACEHYKITLDHIIFQVTKLNNRANVFQKTFRCLDSFYMSMYASLRNVMCKQSH